MLHLPKGYLSYSAITLWCKNKEAYRAKYYRGEEQRETDEMRFGKKIATLLEEGTFEKDSPLAQVPRYSYPEYPLEVSIGNILLKGYVDSYDPETHQFIEYKTGHNSHSGGAPWNKIKVRQHEQLPFYSLLIEVQTGKVDPVCDLIWIETIFRQRECEFDGHILQSDDRELILTGRTENFSRRITKWERERMMEKIISVAQEISNDYETYLGRN